MVNFSKFNSLYSVAAYFNTESKCRQAIIDSRWGDDVVCPYCGQHHCHKRGDGRFCCPKCNNNFSEKVGTIFENTKIPLRKWFMAMYLISSHKKGVSSHQLSRDIDVTQKTAWFILQPLRCVVTLSVTKPTLAVRKRTSTNGSAPKARRGAAPRQRPPCSVWFNEGARW